jgi:MFS family permease
MLPAANRQPSSRDSQKWLALWAAMLGYMLDALDVLLYVFAVQTLRLEFHWSAATAGLVSSATLLASAAGGIGAGILADRFGRTRTLIYAILIYSVGSAGSATSAGLWSLLAWRGVVGLGLGGEWSAGAVLVSESWPAEHRAKAIGVMQSGWAVGYILAAGTTAVILPRFGWRALFLIGILPAFLTLWIQRKVEEPEIWLARKERAPLSSLFRPPLLRTTVLATLLATSVLFAYWGLFTWLPGFLSAPLAQGGAGLNIVRTSGWIILMQAGAFLGYVSFGWFADAFGRRPTFFVYVLLAAIATPVYGLTPRWAGASSETWLLALGPLVGFCGTGFFALFGAMLAELYPTSIRGAGQGFVYNTGRAVSALAPYAVGAIADRQGLGAALALNSAFFLIGSALVFTLPETKNTQLT